MTLQLAIRSRRAVLLLLPVFAAACHSGSAAPGDDDQGEDIHIDAGVDGVTGHMDAGNELDGSPASEDAGIPIPPALWTELTAPAIDVGGGTALAPEGSGARGGLVRLRSPGAITIDPALTVAPSPPLPAVPTAGVALVAADLSADVTSAGTIRIDSMLAASGSDAVRIITSTGGDIVITGELRGADLGAATQSLVLRAPSGNIFVTGTVDSAGGDSTNDGDAAGGIEITARTVVVSGQLIAAGELGGTGAGGTGGNVHIISTNGPVLVAQGSVITVGGKSTTQGGAGGAIDISADERLWLSGTIDTFGGDGRGQDSVGGGAGGAITLLAGDDLDVVSNVRLRGGAASATGTGAAGGAAGALTLDSDGVTRITGIIDGRGGLALDQAGGVVTGGSAGSLLIGDLDRPLSIEIRAPIVAAGGSGLASGGHGGDVYLVATDGIIGVAATIRVDGGDSLRRAGNAGLVEGVAGPVGGGIRLSDLIFGQGGAVMTGGTVNGGTGAVVRLNNTSTLGGLNITASGGLRVDGGAAGTGTGGGGGDIQMRTYDGNASIAGELLSRGGGAQGTGGAGGILELFTDANFNGIGGNLTIETSGLVDVSGGAGAIGGDARNNGGAGVGLFPTYQHQLAVLLNSDGVHGPPQDGALLNSGRIIARGGLGNGSGGDLMFHGRMPNSYMDPVAGLVYLDGDGTGLAGDFVAE